MKKTIITFLAICGVAAAAENYHGSLTSDLTSAITASGYTAGDDFTMSVQLQYWMDNSDTRQTSLTLGDTFHIVSQKIGSWSNVYLGFTPSSTNGTDPGAVNLTRSTSGNTDSYTFTATATATGPDGWITRAANTVNAETGEVTWGATQTWQFLGATLTLSYTAETKTSVLDFDFTTIENDAANGIARPTDRDNLIVTVKGIEIDANDISFASDVTGRNVSFAVVPEPTTATLSLLALAGLAARRRRK